MSAVSSSSSGGSSRLGEWASSLPLVTLTLLVINVAVFVSDMLGDFNANVREFALVPVLAIQGGQPYRIVTAAFMHGGLLHIGMNMMSLIGLGSALEPMFGSLQYLFIQMVFVVAVGTLYVALCYCIALVLPGYQYTGAVGFSGVLFAMAMDEVTLSPYPTRSVFGLFNVPTQLYPWVLMAVLQFLIPNVSLVGHLAGILVGLAHARGLLKWAVPSLSTVKRWEAAPSLQRVVRLGPYRLAPASEVLRESRAVGGAGAVGEWVARAARPITDCFPRWGGRGAGAGATAPPAPLGSPSPSAGSRRIENGRLVSTSSQSAGAGGGGTGLPTPSPTHEGAAARLPTAPAAAHIGDAHKLAAPGQGSQPNGFTLAVKQSQPADGRGVHVAHEPEQHDVERGGTTPESPSAVGGHSATSKAGLAALARLTGAAHPRGAYEKLPSAGPSTSNGAAAPDR